MQPTLHLTATVVETESPSSGFIAAARVQGREEVVATLTKQTSAEALENVYRPLAEELGRLGMTAEVYAVTATVAGRKSVTLSGPQLHRLFTDLVFEFRLGYYID